MANTCLFIGRFQPFHKGHLMVVQGMHKLCGRLVIGIGSPDKSADNDNPFTLETRREMIGTALLEANITDADILEIPDTPSDAQWMDRLLSITGPIETVWTGNDLVAQLFEQKGIGVKRIKEVPGMSGEEIRKRWREGGDWKSMVPEAVADVLARIR